MKFKGLYLSVRQHLPGVSRELLLRLKLEGSDLNQGHPSSSSLTLLVTMCKCICCETQQPLGRKGIHRRESSFSSSFSKGFIPERHILVFLAHTSTRVSFTALPSVLEDATSLRTTLCFYFLSSSSILHLGVRVNLKR